MSRMPETFADHITVIKSLYQDYSKRSDLDTLIQAQLDIKDIYEACSARGADALQAIKELSGCVDELGRSAAYPYREGVHAERVNALQREIDDANQLLAKLDQDTRSAEEQRKQMEEKLQSLTSAAAAEAAARQAEEVFLQHQMSMFHGITNVKWNKNQSAAVAGIVSDTKNGDIRSFHFDPQVMSAFEITNALWDLL